MNRYNTFAPGAPRQAGQSTTDTWSSASHWCSRCLPQARLLGASSQTLCGTFTPASPSSFRFPRRYP